MQVSIEDFRSLVRNTLRGFARVRLPEGIILHDVAIHIRDGKPWAAPPGRPVVARDGRQLKDAAGKPQFSPTLTFTSRADQDAFSNTVIEALRRTHPEALQ
jgi:hypothetical protein